MPNLLLGILASAVQTDYTPPVPAGGVAGYFTQGGNLGDLFRTTFPTDSWSDIGSLPGDGDSAGSGLQDAGVSGYVSQGFDALAAESDILFKVTFPTESISTTTSGLTTMAAGFGISNNGVAGYVGEGFDGVAPSGFVNKFAFPTDSVSAGPTLLDAGADPMDNDEPDGASHHGILGHFLAGTAFGPELGEIQYPTDSTTSHPLPPLAGGFFANAFWQDAGLHTYYTQGFSFSPFPAPSDFVAKYTLATFTSSEIGSLPAPAFFNSGMANDGVAGYVARGGPTGFQTDDVYKITFPTDTWSTTASLPDDAGENAAFANMG